MEFFFTSNSRNFVHTRGLLFISFSISMLTSHLLIFLFENKDAPLFESLRNFNYLSFTIIGKVSAWFLFPKKNRRFVSFISLANSFTFPFVNFSIENQAGLLHFRFHYPWRDKKKKKLSSFHLIFDYLSSVRFIRRGTAASSQGKDTSKIYIGELRVCRADDKGVFSSPWKIMRYVRVHRWQEESAQML